MDLVATYDSDESDGEEKKTSANPAIASDIDIIVITDSDTDADAQGSSPMKCPSLTKGSSDNKLSVKEDNKTLISEIECIDIDETSDIEDEGKNNLVEKVSSNKHPLEIKNSKEVDYLNLDGSDDEQNISQNVNNLLNSATILNDTPCGPQNIKEPNDIINSRLSISKNDSLSHCDYKTKTLDISIEKGVISENIANKRFKRDTETPKSTISATNPDFGENEEPYIQNSFMYRKDERIATAFARSVVCRLPRQVTRHFVNHVNVVTALQWCAPQYSHLLLSASGDCTAKIWDMYCRHPVRTIKDNLGIKAAKWSLSGEQVIIGGYGKKARVYDVLSGKEIISYDMYHYLNSIEVHPYMEDVFLCGTRNAIFGFDLRVNTHLPIRTFLSKCEEVLDIIFLDENEFVCSTSVVSHDSADRTIMVWDFSTGSIMSNQVYLERYTCPSLKVHPHDSSFIAQTNGDYIAAFSTQKPYKIKDKRYMGHKVSGFAVECDISPDGKYIATGDANGEIYFYNYANANIINKLTVRPNTAVNRLKWHPALNSTLATATWDGHIQIWK